MHGVTQVLQVKARLLACTMPEEVQAIASRLRDLQDPLPVAALCLATFDGDAAYCDYVLRSVLDSGDWVAGTFHRRAARGLPVDMRSMVVHRMVYLSRTKHQARGART